MGQEELNGNVEVNVESGCKNGAKGEIGAQEESNDGFLCAPCEDDDNIDGDVQVEFEQQRGAPDPGRPSQAQIDEHNLTHFPFRPWCKACVFGRAKDAPSNKVKGLFAETVLPRVRMDYCFLNEDVEKVTGDEGEGDSEKVGTSITVAVMQESLCKSVWAYAVEQKGSMERWVIEQACEDLETVGL